MTQPNELSQVHSPLAGSPALPAFPGQPILALIVVKDSRSDRVISWRTRELSTVAAYIDILQTLNPNPSEEKEA